MREENSTSDKKVTTEVT